MLGRALTADLERVLPPGIEVRRSGEEESEAWLEVVAEGSTHPDTQGVPWHEEFPREMIIEVERDMAAVGVAVRYAGLRDGIIAGGAAMDTPRGDLPHRHNHTTAKNPAPLRSAGCCRLPS